MNGRTEAISIHQANPQGTGAIGIAETKARAGVLLELGAAFMKLQADTAQTQPGDANIDSEPRPAPREEHFDVVIVGAGQSGLSVGYYLAGKGIRFVILEARQRVGDIWRARWDSLRLFTPARFDGLAGMRFPAPAHFFPTRDEMADYLEAYAEKFALPVRTGTKVDEVSRHGERYVVTAGASRFTADHVVIAAASYQKPKLPDFAALLDPAIRQFHSSAYQNSSQLRPGGVLLVGAGNSGAEIAMDLAGTRRVWLAGRHPGHIPVAYNGTIALRVVIPFVFRVLLHRLLSVDTPIGRKARPAHLVHGLPLIRVRPQHMDAAGINRVARVAAVKDGKPVLETGEALDVENVIWCTGFRPGLDWVKLPVFDVSGRPGQYRGAVTGEPGLYVCGLPFQHSPSSTMIHGAERDAGYVADTISERMRIAKTWNKT